MQWEEKYITKFCIANLKERDLVEEGWCMLEDIITLDLGNIHLEGVNWIALA
jgi:hypothetical protein